MKTLTIEYRDGETVLEGFCAYDEKIAAKKPVILIAHDWSGKNKFACDTAERLAELGYVGFALDMYGKGILGKTKEEKSALIKPFVEDRKKLLKRIMAGLQAAQNLDPVASEKVGAIGFCFGGLCVLDLARSGADVTAVVSFHGLLNPPQDMEEKKISTKILVLHGYDDPMVTPDKISIFANEMNHAKADWQFNIYSHTMHAFTNPEANDPGFGTVYNKKTATRAWIAMREFFREVF